MDQTLLLEYMRKISDFYNNILLPYFLTADYQGKPLALFSLQHLIALGVILLFILMIFFSRKNFTEKKREDVRDTMAAILVLNEIAWHLWNYFFREWTIQEFLPLHICSVLVWLGALMLVTKSYRIYEFMYLLGIGSALQALLTPDTGIYGFPHFRVFQTFISHGFIIIAALYMTFVEEMRPTWISTIRVFLITNVYMVAVYFINNAIGSNYLFINHKPPTASILDLLPEWPTYILYMEAIGIITIFLLYLPFLIKDIVNRLKMRNSGNSRLDSLDDMLS